MSLILDALSRAERERRASEQPVPDLLTPAASGARWRPPLGIVALLLLPFLALLLWWAMAGSPAADRAGDGDVPAPAQASVGARTLPVGPVASPGRGSAPKNSAVASTPALSSPGLTSPGLTSPRAGGDVPRNDTSAAGDVSGARRQRAAIAALYAEADADMQQSMSQQRGSDASPTVERTPAQAQNLDSAPPAATGEGAGGELPASAGAEESDIDLEALLERVQEEQGSSTLMPHPAPMLSATSQQFRDRVPTLMYLRHDYRADGGSSVVLNGHALAAGEQTDGVRVMEILPDSVVLRFDDRDFRLKSLSSWVNL